MSKFCYLGKINSSSAILIQPHKNSKAICRNISKANTVLSMNKRREITDEQKADAARLKAVFQARQKEAKAQGKKLTQADLGEMCGWESGQSAASQYLNAYVPLNIEALLRLSKALEFDPSDVSPSLASAIKSVPGTFQTTKAAGGSPSGDDYVLIPRYCVTGSCGDGYLNDHVEVNGGLAFRRDWIKQLGCKADDLYVIYAEGDSMEPYIFAGDIVLLDTGALEAKDRQVYALRRADGTISIKRLVQQVVGGWVIRSDNPDKSRHPDESVAESVLHEIPILGRVIWRGGGVG